MYLHSHGRGASGPQSGPPSSRFTYKSASPKRTAPSFFQPEHSPDHGRAASYKLHMVLETDNETSSKPVAFTRPA